MSSSTFHPRAAKILIATGVVVFASFVIGLMSEHPLASTWFYVAAWWSWIAIADGIVHLRCKRSLALSSPRSFALLAVWSAFFWLLYEMANLRLQNWYYVGIPASVFARSVGVFVAFATVLPGVFETRDFLASFGVFERWRCAPWRISRGGSYALQALGIACIVLPLAFPRYAYPLIWGAMTLVCEPWLWRRGERGLLTRLAAGDPRMALTLLLAGFATGGLWESWNFHADSKWIYTVPFFEDSKLFEMPIPGFLGFPPFALECFTFARVLVALRLVPEWDPTSERESRASARGAFQPRLAWFGAAISVLASVPAIWAVNHFTVRSTLPRVADIPDIDARFAEDLRARGIETLGRWRRERESLESELRRIESPRALARWIAIADLMEVKGLGARGQAWLASIGVEDVPALSASDPERLHARLSTLGRGPAPEPSRAEVRVWVRGARHAEETLARR